jgi:pimeloyl-ACP methyl ester carboxylesterase
LLTIDLKGFGLSGHPRDGRYAIDDNVDIVIDLMTQLRLSRVVLIGHSYGGAVAAVVTSRLRASRSSQVDGLVLIDAASYQQRLPFFVGGLRNPILRWLSPFMGSARTRSRVVLNSLFVDRALIDDEIVERYAFPMRIAGSNYGYAQTALQIMPESFEAVTATLRAIDVPTQIIWGEGDRAVPLAFARRLHEDIRGSRLAVIPGVGHMPHEERPGEVMRLLDVFLNGLPAAIQP